VKEDLTLGPNTNTNDCYSYICMLYNTSVFYQCTF